MPSPRLQRASALGLLGLVVLAGGATAWSWIDAYAEGQREIADKRDQLRSLRELTDARTGLQKLRRPSGGVAPIVTADGTGQDALTAAVNHAADGQQVIVDGIEPLPAEGPLVSAAVHLRTTQSGLYTFLHAIEAQTPYLLVPRLEVQTFRAADPGRGKPLVLSADLRLSALAAPPPPTASRHDAAPTPP